MLGRATGKRGAVVSSGALSPEVILREGVHPRPDVDALAAAPGHRLLAIVWNYSITTWLSPPTLPWASVGWWAPARVLLEHYRIDGHHSNAYRV